MGDIRICLTVEERARVGTSLHKEEESLDFGKKEVWRTRWGGRQKKPSRRGFLKEKVLTPPSKKRLKQETYGKQINFSDRKKMSDKKATTIGGSQ